MLIITEEIKDRAMREVTDYFNEFRGTTLQRIFWFVRKRARKKMSLT